MQPSRSLRANTVIAADQPSTPAVILTAVGGIAMTVGLMAVIEGAAARAPRDLLIGGAGLISGAFLFGLAYAIRMLQQIEEHLRPKVRSSWPPADASPDRPAYSSVAWRES